MKKKINEDETLEEIVSTEMVKVNEEPKEVSLFGTRNPKEILTCAVETANILKPIIVEKRLFTNIKGKNYVHAEGWTLLGSLLNVYPRIIEVIDMSVEEVGVKRYVADCEVRTMSNLLLSQAQSECSNQEKSKSYWEDYALRSMAETRAISKALRIPLGFIIKLAGYEPTPAEEIDAELIEKQEEPVLDGNGKVDDLLTELNNKFPDTEGVTIKHQMVNRIYYMIKKTKLKMKDFEEKVINTDLMKVHQNIVQSVYNVMIGYCKGRELKKVEL
jgi:hypothetical protein